MENGPREGFKTMVSISVDREGTLGVTQAAGLSREVVVAMLTDALKAAKERVDEKRIISPVRLSSGGVRNWVNRKMGKRR